MSLLVFAAGLLTIWVVMAIVGVAVWALLNAAAESAESYVAAEHEREFLEER